MRMMASFYLGKPLDTPPVNREREMPARFPIAERFDIHAQFPREFLLGFLQFQAVFAERDANVDGAVL